MPIEPNTSVTDELCEVSKTDVTINLSPFQNDEQNCAQGLSIPAQAELDINILNEPLDDKLEKLEQLLLRQELISDRESFQVNPKIDEELVDFEISDDEIFESFPSHKTNMRTIGLQTSEIHFGKVEKTK